MCSGPKSSRGYEAFSLKERQPGDKHSNTDVGLWIPQMSKIRRVPDKKKKSGII